MREIERLFSCRRSTIERAFGMSRLRRLSGRSSHSPSVFPKGAAQRACMPEGPAAVRAGLLTVVALAVAVLSCARAIDPLPGYRRASEAERAAVLRVIADYYTRRERAALTGDASVLFSAYPQLADGEDRARGVNADAFFFERMRAVRIAGLTFDLDGYEPIGVYVRDDTALAFVHGLETWLNGFGPVRRAWGSGIRGRT